MRSLAGCLVALLLLTFAPSARPIPAAVPPTGFGFSTGSAWEYSTVAEIDREFDAIARTGASWLRILIDWNRVEPTKGHFEFGKLDAIVASAQRHQLSLLGLIAYTAQWARPPGSFFTSYPSDPTTFATFATVVVDRYRDRISRWEIWNEPNLPQFTGLNAAGGDAYATLLKATYPAIKALQPNSTVVAAGLSRSLGTAAPPAFLQQMYAAGAHGFFDAAAAHPYVFPAGIGADPEHGWSDVERMHEVMAAYGDGEKAIWFTELGAPTNDPAHGGLSQEAQAEQIADVLAAAAMTPYSGPAFIYGIRDIDTTDTLDREMNFGALLTSDWRPKFAATTLAR
ncbi:hypothetical protein FK535_19345 [Mycolicibacterium sp. 018/SC-01/001]|nr:hypothetical protein FK535_19345 [Mycolicibacterium sp. 018/SC-01/001]